MVTIPEGMPSVLVHERLMRVPYLTGALAVPAEGSVLPDTYTYQPRREPGGGRWAGCRQAMTTGAGRGSGRSAARRPVAQSPQAAIILASIVEKETGKPSERRMVAGVYSNRLGAACRCRPTRPSSIPSPGPPLGRRILQSELRRE